MKLVVGATLGAPKKNAASSRLTGSGVFETFGGSQAVASSENQNSLFVYAGCAWICQSTFFSRLNSLFSFARSGLIQNCLPPIMTG